jgi:lipid II isoglutaminyl synthase (glutamine-hydrolysing)
MRLFLAVLVGKLVRQVVKLRGGGSAYPGRFALFLFPNLIKRTLSNFRLGVVLVSGSNGKSTTTSLAVAALESQGLKVFTNSSGSNMPRGIGSAIISSASLAGVIDADIAVIEVDEGYAQQIAKELVPNWFVLTNIQIDQLNRFYEPDRVFEMLLDAATFATDGVIVNGSDANLIELISRLGTKNVYQVNASAEALRAWPKGALAAPIFGLSHKKADAPVLVSIESVTDGVSALDVSGKKVSVSMPGKGLHFAIATSLSIALASKVSGADFDLAKAVAEIGSQPTVYGRGEVISHEGVSFQIMMMKNPPSMQANLVAMGKTKNNIWIAVDEGTPDTSWIYDIDFSGVSGVEVISGSMAWHLALRLRYEGIPVHSVIPDSKDALQRYVDYLSSIGEPGTLLSNYEQMMLVRKLIGHHDLEGGRS